MKPQTFTATQSSRLDHFLVDQLPELSRAQVQKLIKSSQVKVNRKTAKKTGQMLEMGNKVTLLDTRGHAPGQESKEVNATPPHYRLLHETSDYLIIHKPAGLTMHAPESPPRTHGSSSEAKRRRAPGLLTTQLLHDYPELATVGDQPQQRPGIVHRLDRDVSGIMVVARTQKMFKYLKRQFKNRKVDKTYLALVHGQIRRDGEIDLPLEKRGIVVHALTRGHAPGQENKEASLSASNTRTALTHYHPRTNYQHYTLLEVTILTGRTHQIRVHLAAINHPIVGDKKYADPQKYKSNLKRPWLHAWQLGFADLDGQWQEFEVEPTAELREFLGRQREV